MRFNIVMAIAEWERSKRRYGNEEEETGCNGGGEGVAVLCAQHM